MITFNMLDTSYDEKLKVRIFDYRFGSTYLEGFPQDKSFQVGEKTKSLDEQLNKFVSELEKKELVVIKKAEAEKSEA